MKNLVSFEALADSNQAKLLMMFYPLGLENCSKVKFVPNVPN